MTDHLSNTEVGAYVRLLASYWEKNGLPLDQRALNRIAKIEPEDDVDLSAILGEFFSLEDGNFSHEYLDALRVDAIGEEDAKKRRTLPARQALAAQRRSVTMPVAETEVDVDVETEEEPESEREGDSNSDSKPRNQTQNQTENPQSEQDSHPDGIPRNQANTQTAQAEQDSGLRQAVGDSGPQVGVQTALSRAHQGVSLKPDCEAQSEAVPAASSAQSGRAISAQMPGQTLPRHAAMGLTTEIGQTAATGPNSFTPEQQAEIDK